MHKPHILLVEDDENLGKLLSAHLDENGFRVQLLANGNDAKRVMSEIKFNICIFDIMLPGIDGLQLAKGLKEKQPDVPFIFLSARNLKSDKINGYKTGADDYVSKPFDPEELTLKIQAILRRCQPTVQKTFRYEAGGFVLNCNLRTLEVDDWNKKLSTKENDLLQLLFQSVGEIVPREKALNEVWGRSDYFTSKSMDVYITKIRKMLANGSDLVLENIHGYGFKLVEHQNIT